MIYEIQFSSDSEYVRFDSTFCELSSDNVMVVMFDHDYTTLDVPLVAHKWRVAETEGYIRYSVKNHENSEWSLVHENDSIINHLDELVYEIDGIEIKTTMYKLEGAPLSRVSVKILSEFKPYVWYHTTFMWDCELHLTELVECGYLDIMDSDIYLGRKAYRKNSNGCSIIKNYSQK